MTSLVFFNLKITQGELDYLTEIMGYEDKGPDFVVDICNPDVHDMLRSGGGSFASEFEAMEK